MATYQITSEQEFAKIDLNVSFSLNVTATYANQVFSNLEGAQLNAQFQAYSDAIENEIKALGFFSTQDSNRNATFELTPDPTQNPPDGYTGYVCTTTFTIENAVVSQTANTETNLTGEEKDAFLADFANSVETQFKSERTNWVDL